MSRSYEELDRQDTAIGELVLRRRSPPGFAGRQITEIMLGHDLLMSSYLNESERQLASKALDAVPSRNAPLAVVIGGLGLGHTAEAALEDARVGSVRVIEFLPTVVGWHVRGLVPLGPALTSDPRVRIQQGDFFAWIAGLRLADTPGDGFDAILVDIDHAPDERLDVAHGGFYATSSLTHVATLVRPGGVFAFWSAGAPQPAFHALLDGAFARVATHEVVVYNPMIDEEMVDTIYVATTST